MSVEARIHDALDQVDDPEIPISLRDLGVLRHVEVAGAHVRVLLVPTRLACPARDEMARRVRAAVHDVDPDLGVTVEWEMTTWRPMNVTPGGCTVLQQAGFSTPSRSTPACPYCGSPNVRTEGSFGGSLCKRPYTCRSCGSTFDALRGELQRDEERPSWTQ